MEKYKYRPVRFYLFVFGFTWLFWITSIFIRNSDTAMSLMTLGLFVPAVTAVITVMRSKNKALKMDLRRKIVGFYRIRPWSVLAAVVLFSAIVAASILASALFGQSLDQFSFTDGFSFSIHGSSALLTILLASVIEEVGWRGYGEDSIAEYHSWFKESILFGFIWSLWHLPLFFIEGTYHAGLAALGTGYVSKLSGKRYPLGFLTTWVYVKNNRSMLACIVFHLFVNFFQEKIAMTPQTKCIETVIITLAAVIIVLTNKTMFFETKHIGNLLGYKPGLKQRREDVV
jgi:membrane protease YdiL (CAAX protease family)